MEPGTGMDGGEDKARAELERKSAALNGSAHEWLRGELSFIHVWKSE